MASIDLFTDASYAQHKKPTHFGIGIFMIDYQDDEKEYFASSRVQFSSVENKMKEKYKNKIIGNLTLFEIYAMVKGIKWAAKIASKNTDIDTIRVYTDSLNAVECYHELAEHPMFKGFISSMKHQITGIEKTNNLKIEICHIKAHCGVYGNNKADRLAKKKN